MRRIILGLAALVVVGLACDGITDLWDGPVAFGIVGGDGQVVEAGRDSLLAPVVGRAVRDESGQVSFLLGASPLHAQATIATGVPNVRTCAAPAEEHGLVPWLQCIDTDSEGFVEYWFDPPTVAGERCAEIRALIDRQPEVVATTCATVEPGPLAGTWAREEAGGIYGQAVNGNQLMFPTEMFRDAHHNAVPYTLGLDEELWDIEPHAASFWAWMATRSGGTYAAGDTIQFTATVRDEATTTGRVALVETSTGGIDAHIVVEWPPDWH